MDMRRIPLILILLVALLLRIIHIGFPVGGFMSWRQADTAAMARNFYAHGFDFFRPQIDWGGSSDGTVETEFPLYSYLAALLYKLFTPCDTWGRILSVLFSLATIIGLYRVVDAILGRRTALWASALYAVLPLNVFYGRAIMPESMMLMCTVWGLFFFVRWSLTRGRTALLLSALCIAIAALLKLPALYAGIPLLFLAARRGWGDAFKTPSYWLYTLIILLPVAAWYYHAYELGRASGLSFGIWDRGSGNWGNLEILFTPKFYNDVFFKSIAERHLTYAGFIIFLAGLFVPRHRPEERFFDWWLGGVCFYILIVARGNQTYEYYQLPFTLPASVFMAKAISETLSPDNIRQYWKRKRALVLAITLCLAALPILSGLRIAHYLKGERFDDPVLQLGNISRRMGDAGAKVIAVDDGNPFMLYACGLSGWHASEDKLSAAAAMRLHFEGAEYIVGTTATYDTPARRGHLRALLQTFPAIAHTDEYFILRLVMEPRYQ